MHHGRLCRAGRELDVASAHGHGRAVSRGRFNACAETAGIHQTHVRRRRLRDVDLYAPGVALMREPVAKRSPKHRGRVGNTDHLAVVQPVRHDARRQENLRIAILVALEEKNVPKQKQEFRASPAMWDVAHVPKPVRHLAEIFGDG